MPHNLDQAFGIHATALSLRSQRAELLAGNLANADTPHYKAKDLDFTAALQTALKQPQQTASDSAFSGTRPVIVENHIKYRLPSQPALDGNTVDNQAEQARFGENALKYQTSMSFLNHRISLLKTAITGN